MQNYQDSYPVMLDAPHTPNRNVDAWQRIWEGLVVALLQPLPLLLEAPAMIQILNLHCLRTTQQFSLGGSIYSRKLFAINLLPLKKQIASLNTHMPLARLMRSLWFWVLGSLSVAKTSFENHRDSLPRLNSQNIADRMSNFDRTLQQRMHTKTIFSRSAPSGKFTGRQNVSNTIHVIAAPLTIPYCNMGCIA